MDITFAITVRDEVKELERLLNSISTVSLDKVETILLIDTKNNESLKEILDITSKFKCFCSFGDFNGDFANWKNIFFHIAKGKYIFQLDADEYLSNELIEILPVLLQAISQNDIDLVWFPRINTVEGITQEDIQKWNWNINSKGYINYPDIQGRLYKNSYPDIKWEGKVHERINGSKLYSILEGEQYVILHPKDIIRQRKQNEFYNTLTQ